MTTDSMDPDAPTPAGFRYFMTLAYDGQPFHGWQSQPNAMSVQQTIEEALAKILRAPTPIVGAGRTDAGVHARRMVAHFTTPAPLQSVDELTRRLNAIVGRSIAILDIRPVAPDSHARFDACSRTYHYLAHTVKNPFLDKLSWQASPQLDFDLMNQAATLLLGTQDFTSFAKLHSDARTNICTVTEARWMPVGDSAQGRWEFVITADRFLRNMVRAIVGTLVEVGRHKMTVQQFGATIGKLNRSAAGTSMPGHALYLWDVKYPWEQSK